MSFTVAAENGKASPSPPVSTSDTTTASSSNSTPNHPKSSSRRHRSSSSTSSWVNRLGRRRKNKDLSATFNLIDFDGKVRVDSNLGLCVLNMKVSSTYLLCSSKVYLQKRSLEPFCSERGLTWNSFGTNRVGLHCYNLDSSFISTFNHYSCFFWSALFKIFASGM